jgi:hypothetical protein
VSDQHDGAALLGHYVCDLIRPTCERDLGQRRLVLTHAQQVGSDNPVAFRLEFTSDQIPAPATMTGAMNKYKDFMIVFQNLIRLSCMIVRQNLILLR